MNIKMHEKSISLLVILIGKLRTNTKPYKDNSNLIKKLCFMSITKDVSERIVNPIEMQIR